MAIEDSINKIGEITVYANGAWRDITQVHAGSSLVWEKEQAVTSLLNGLISCWEFDETSGTTIFDNNNNNNGVNYGAAINQTGIINKACSFYSNDYINAGNDNSLNVGSGDISISVWLKLNALGNWIALVDKRDYPTIGYSFYLSKYNKLRFSIGTMGVATLRTVRESVNTIALSTWTHLTSTFINSTGEINLYVNGVLSNADYINRNAMNEDFTNSGDLYLGGDVTYNRWYLNGLIDQTAIWNKKLTQAEVTALYNGGAGLPYSNF